MKFKAKNVKITITVFGNQIWEKNSLLHRECRPTIIWNYLGMKEWYLNGYLVKVEKTHR